ncbi:MAG: hypothetical protein Kow0075_02260 [Salibacteraceae bacterium]
MGLPKPKNRKAMNATSKRIKKAYGQVLFLIALVSIALGACEKNEPAEGFSRLKVVMHDTAADYQAVNVEIIGAMACVHSNGDSGWYALEVNSGVYNLLELQNGIDTVLVNDTEIPSGHLTQLRLILGDSNSVVLSNDTQLLPMKTPSAQQSGLKINVNQALLPGKEYEITLDFDAYHSVILKGNNEFQLKPVIKIDQLIAL